jgi:hypothetical protein
VSPKYILLVAKSISVIPLSPYVCIERLRNYMRYHDVANLVTVTKTHMIDEMLCGYRTLKTTGVKISHRISRRACAAVSAALEVSRRPVQRSQQLHNLTILILNLVAS